MDTFYKFINQQTIEMPGKIDCLRQKGLKMGTKIKAQIFYFIEVYFENLLI